MHAVRAQYSELHSVELCSTRKNVDPPLNPDKPLSWLHNKVTGVGATRAAVAEGTSS